jgi:hypothetical protein
MKYKYLGQSVIVLVTNETEALIQKQSGKQPKWIDIRLLEVSK